MAKLSILAGATSQSVNIFIQDSSSTVGAGLSGLVFNTSGLIGYYTFAGANASSVQITLATLAAVNSAYSSGGFKEIDATNMKGLYRLDLPNAAIASAKGRSVTVMLSGATNMAPLALEIELTGWDNQDGVRGGMTALPNAAANAAGGLPVSIAGALDLDEMNVDIEAIQTSTAGLTFTGAGKVDASVRDWIGGTIPAVNVTGVPLVDLKYTLGTISPAAAGSVSPDWGQVVNKTATNNLSATTIATVTNQLTAAAIATGIWQDTTAGDFTTALSVGKSVMNGVALGTGLTINQLTTNNDKTGYSLTQTFPTNFSATLISAGGHISNVDTLTTYTGNTVQTGDNFARLGAPAGASVSADIAAVKTDVDAVPTANANADALLDRASGVETSWTFRQVMRVVFAACAGKADGLATTTAHYRDQADTKNRITATVDANGNRTAITLDAS